MSNIWLRVNSVSVSIIAFDPQPSTFYIYDIEHCLSALSLLPVGISHFITMNSLADGPDKKNCLLILQWEIRTKVLNISSEK